MGAACAAFAAALAGCGWAGKDIPDLHPSTEELARKADVICLGVVANRTSNSAEIGVTEVLKGNIRSGDAIRLQARKSLVGPNDGWVIAFAMQEGNAFFAASDELGLKTVRRGLAGDGDPVQPRWIPLEEYKVALVVAANSPPPPPASGLGKPEEQPGPRGPGNTR